MTTLSPERIAEIKVRHDHVESKSMTDFPDLADAEQAHKDRGDLLDALSTPPLAEGVRSALMNLVAKIKECGEVSLGVFQIAAIHGYSYSGPNWTKEVQAAEAALASKPIASDLVKRLRANIYQNALCCEAAAALEAKPTVSEIVIHLERREDGGLRIYSPNNLGLILSGADPQKMCAAIWPALEALKAVEPANALEAKPVAGVDWKYCPECGCEELHHEEGAHKQCKNCHQEWFSDLDYSDVVRKHLAARTKPIPIAAPDEAELRENIKTALRRFGGIPALARSEGDADKIIDVVMAEFAAMSRVRPTSTERDAVIEECARRCDELREEYTCGSANWSAFNHTASEIRALSQSPAAPRMVEDVPKR